MDVNRADIYKGIPSNNRDVNIATIWTGDKVRDGFESIDRDKNWCKGLLAVKNDNKRNRVLFEQLRTTGAIIVGTIGGSLSQKSQYKIICSILLHKDSPAITDANNYNNPWWSIAEVNVAAMYGAGTEDHNPFKLRWETQPSLNEVYDAILTSYTIDEWRTANLSPFNDDAISNYWPVHNVQGPFIDRVAVTKPELLALLAPVCNDGSILSIISNFLDAKNSTGLDMFLCGIAQIKYTDKRAVYRKCKALADKDELDTGCVCILLHHNLLDPNVGRPWTPYRTIVDNATQPARVMHDLMEASRKTMLNRIGMKYLLFGNLFNMFVAYVKAMKELPEHLDETRWVVQAWRSQLTSDKIIKNFFGDFKNKPDNEIRNCAEKYERIGIRIKRTAFETSTPQDDTVWNILKPQNCPENDEEIVVQNADFSENAHDHEYKYIQRDTDPQLTGIGYLDKLWFGEQHRNASPPRADANWPWNPAFTYKNKQYIECDLALVDTPSEHKKKFDQVLETHKPALTIIHIGNQRTKPKQYQCGKTQHTVVKSNDRDFTDV